MRILISDYSGHPFQVQLSRELARRGHDVLHVFSASFQTPKGRLVRDADDPPGFNIAGVRTKAPFAKHAFVKRRSQEIEIGDLVAAQIAEFRPDVVISSNAPLDTQRRIQAAARRAGAWFVFWVQDIYSHAITQVLRARLPLAGRPIGAYYRWLEASMLKASDHAVVIAEDFKGPVRDLAGPRLPMTVIENWAPLDEIAPYPRDNEWALSNLRPASFRLVYSGTIGFKHNPVLLLKLAENVEGDVLVFSEGPAADWLAAEASARGLDNLIVSGWLPFDDLPKALSAADALIVILEPEAGIYSVPSKVLTYMCIGRPILGAMPKANLAARTITSHAMGRTVEPDDAAGLVSTARDLAADPEQRSKMGQAAYQYAQRTFDIATIANKFEAILPASAGKKGASLR